MDNLNSFNKIRFSIMARGLLPAFLSIFRKLDKDLIIFNSHFNLKFNSNTKYLFFYFLKNRKETVKFVMNDDDERVRLTELYGDHFIETKSFRGRMYALKARTWFTNSYDLPVGGVFLKFHRNIVCLSHGSPIKNEGTLERDTGIVKKLYYTILRTDFSHVLATADDFAKVYASYMKLPLKKILISGLPQFDEFSSEKKKDSCVDKSLFSILYAPTWRHYGNPPLFDFEDFDASDFSNFLKENGIMIYLRLHPNYGDDLPESLSGISNICKFSGKMYPDIMEYLTSFDALITDYSSIALDFLPLNRPLFYMISDYDEYDKQIGFCVDYNHWSPGYKPKTYAEFKKALLDAKTNDSYKAQREQLMKEYACQTGGNCARLVSILEEKNILKR